MLNWYERGLAWAAVTDEATVIQLGLAGLLVCFAAGVAVGYCWRKWQIPSDRL